MISLVGLPLQLGYCRTRPVGWWIFDRDHIQQTVTDLVSGNDVALSKEEVLTDFKAKKWRTFESLRFNVPPYAQFTSPNSALVYPHK